MSWTIRNQINIHAGRFFSNASPYAFYLHHVLRSCLPEAALLFPDGWATVDFLVLLCGGSGSTRSGVSPEIFLTESVLVVERFDVTPLFLLKASVWENVGVITVMLRLVSGERTGFWLIPGICLPLAVWSVL